MNTYMWHVLRIQRPPLSTQLKQAFNFHTLPAKRETFYVWNNVTVGTYTMQSLFRMLLSSYCTWYVSLYMGVYGSIQFRIQKWSLWNLFTYSIVDSRYNEILLITIPNLYPNHSQAIEIQTGYIDSLDILIHFPYPISIVITRAYCI